MDLKAYWLTQLNPEWLIQVHLNEKEALELVKLAEKALDFTPIGPEEVPLNRCIKLEPKIYELKRKNKLETNPNSCCLVTFANTVESCRF
jgi:hypothetical protein